MGCWIAKYPWVKVDIESDMTALDIVAAVEAALGDNGDVPIEGVADFRKSVIEIGALRSAFFFVRVFKEMS